MKKNIILYLLFIFSIATYSQEKESNLKYTINLNSNINFESNTIDKDFIDLFLYGGEISPQQKNKWIKNSHDFNVVNLDLHNNIGMKYKKAKNTFSFNISDINSINTSFTNDFLGFILKGNYYYQGDTLDFKKTSLRINRYQQIKLTYKRDIHRFKVGTAISYLSGNHHYSYIMNKGKLYTENGGTFLDLNYQINAFATDTKNLSLFNKNIHLIQLTCELLPYNQMQL